MIKIRVPATSANLGPGFDTIGMAFKIYNHTWVEPLPNDAENVFISKRFQSEIPQDETNLIYQTIKFFYDKYNLGAVPKVKIIQEDYIPMTRGLGSSAACIVAGLFAANVLSGLGLSDDELAKIAVNIEGHPDNVAPAIMGGIVIGAMTGDEFEYIKINTADSAAKDISFTAMIPDFMLSTEVARGILPKSYDLHDAIFNASRSALLVAALLTGRIDKLVTATDDRIHQPYRANIIPNMDEIFKKSKQLGAIGVFLSGAGPTLVAMNNRPFFNVEMKEFLKTLPNNWELIEIEPDNDGVLVEIE